MNAEYIINITGKVNELFDGLESEETCSAKILWDERLHGVLEGIDILLDTLDCDDVHAKVLSEMLTIWNERVIDFWSAQIK